jgi:hypothetical protein
MLFPTDPASVSMWNTLARENTRPEMLHHEQQDLSPGLPQDWNQLFIRYIHQSLQIVMDVGLQIVLRDERRWGWITVNVPIKVFDCLLVQIHIKVPFSIPTSKMFPLRRRRRRPSSKTATLGLILDSSVCIGRLRSSLHGASVPEGKLKNQY